MFYLIIYLLLWIITFIYYQKKKTFFDTGSVVIMSYIVYAICSVLLINNVIVAGKYNDITLFPFIYLWVMLLIANAPAMQYNGAKVKYVQIPNNKIINLLLAIIISASIFLVHSVVQHFNTGVISIMTDTSTGAEVYKENAKNADLGGKGISNLPMIIYSMFRDIAIFLLFYYLAFAKNYKYSKYIIPGLFLSTLISLVETIASGGRGGLQSFLVTFVGAYFLFRPFLTQKTNKRIVLTSIILVVAVYLPFKAITDSRFDDRAGGSQSYVIDYAGQAPLNFNNYGLDAGGIHYGDRTFNLLKQVIDSDTPKNFYERRIKYYQLKMDDNIFYTFVGDFTLDFGPITAFFMFVVFNYIVCRATRVRNKTICFHQLLLIYFTICVSLQGGMSLYRYADTAGLLVVALFLIYFICLFDYYRLKNRKIIIIK